MGAATAAVARVAAARVGTVRVEVMAAVARVAAATVMAMAKEVEAKGGMPAMVVKAVLMGASVAVVHTSLQRQT